MSATKRSQILDLLPTHTLGQIKEITNYSGDTIRKIAKSAGLTWIKDDLRIKENKILSLIDKHSKKEIQSIVGCSASYIGTVFRTHNIIDKKTVRTRDVVVAMSRKHSELDIANELNIHVDTVRTYLRNANIASERSAKTTELISRVRELGATCTVFEIAKSLNQSTANIRRIISKHKIPYCKVKREAKEKSNNVVIKSKRTEVLELAPNHTVKEIASMLNTSRPYVYMILKQESVTAVSDNQPKCAKPIVVKPRNVAKTSKTVSSKIKLSQDDMQKGNAKLTPAEKVLPTLTRDDSKARIVKLDNRTTKLLYPGQVGYDAPIEVLRSEWQKKQEKQLKILKGA